LGVPSSTFGIACWKAAKHEPVPLFWDTGESPNQRLKLTGAAILVSRASTFFQAAPAA